MTIELAALATKLTSDTTDYVRGMDAAADAAKRTGQATDKLGETVEVSNRKVRNTAAELERWKRQIDPLHASQRKLEQGTAALNRALENGLSAQEHHRLMGLLIERYDAAGQAAKRAAKAQADATQATRAGALAAGALRGGVDELASRLGVAGSALTGLSGAALAAAASIAAVGLGAAALVGASISAAGGFQTLQATLRTVGGSAQLAAAEFEVLKQFALDTPVTVEQATQAFIKLKALGLDATVESMKSYGNTAGALGKSVQDMVEAVADATTGEFERLKEFGIKASAEGDRVSFVFQGVKTTVGNNAREIEKYLQGIGNTKFATGMAEQSATLSGAINNLSDNWEIFLANLGESGPVQAAIALINGLADAVNGLNGMLFPSIDKQIADTTAGVQALRAELDEMRKHAEAYGPEIAAREAALKQQEQVLAGLARERAERDRLLAQSRVRTETEKELSDEEKKAREAAAKAAAKEAERRQGVLDKLGTEWDERTRILDATKAGERAVESLTVDLEGERAMRELLGVATNAQARAIMDANPALREQALRARDTARANEQLKQAVDEVKEAEKARTARLKEDAAAQTKYAEEIAETAGRMSQDVAADLFDALTDPDREASVLDFFKSMFKRIAVEAAAQQIVLPIMTQVVGAAPSMFGVQAPPGGGQSYSSINSPGFMNSASSLWSSATGSGFGSQVAMGSGAGGGLTASINSFGASAFGMAPGTVTAAPSAAFVGPMPMQAGSSSMLGGSTLTGAMAGGLAGAAAGGMVGTMIGNATQSKAIGAGSGALTGAGVGFLVGGPVGAAIGAIGGALMAALGTEGKPSNKEGNAVYDMQTGRTKVGGQTGDKFSQENRDAATSAARAFGGIGELLADFSKRTLANSIKVVMGDRDGMSAQMGNAKVSFKKRNDDAMRDMTRWFVDQFAAQLGQDLPGDVRTALQRVDWRDVETALEDIAFAGTFRDKLKALSGDFGLVDEATESTRAEVKALTDGIIEFKSNTARLGLDTAAAANATRSFVEGLLGLRAVAEPMNNAETAVALLKVRFDEMAPLLREVGINADEAAKGLQRAIAALRDDFVAGLDREFNELRGAGWINQIDDTFAMLADRMRSAAALGGGSHEALRNNHYAIRNILEELSDEQLGEAAARYGGDIAVLTEHIRAARVVVEEAAPVVGEAVMDVAAWLKGLEREANESSGRGSINQITDQFAKMTAQLGEAAQAGLGADIVLANNHRAMVNLLTALGDDQLGDAARTFGGDIAIIAEGLLASRRALAAQEAAAEAARLAEEALARAREEEARRAEQIAGQREQLERRVLELSGDTAEIRRRELAALDESLRPLQQRIWLLEDEAVAAQAAEQARRDAIAAADARVEAARGKVQDAYQREISAQEALADAARATSDRMRQFATGFKGLRDSLLTGDLSPLSPSDRYAEARRQFEDVAGKAAAGDESAMAQLEQASQNFLQQSRSYYASSATYTADFQMVSAALAQAEASASQQASAADQALSLATQQRDLLQGQLDAINGTTNAVLTIPEAMAELTSALLAQAQAGGGAGGNPNGVDLITAAYRQYLGRDPEAGGYAFWQGHLQQGTSIGDVVNGIANSQEAKARAAQSGTLAILGAVNRTATPANDTGIAVLTDATLHQTAALQDGLGQLIKITARQGQDIAELRSAQRRMAAS